MAQKRRTVFTVLGALLAIAMSASAAIAAPSFFSTQDECEKAVLAGAYAEYVPKHFKNHTKNPVDGEKRVVASLEFVACVDMSTTSGRKWVVQTPGAEFRFRVAEDGSLLQPPYARHDCGNKVYSISYPQAPTPEPAKTQAPPLKEEKMEAPVQPVAVAKTPVRDICGELGLYGEKFANQLDEKGRPYCEEDIPWHKTTTTKWIVGGVVVTVVAYCAFSGRCGFWKRGGGGGGIPPTGPSGGGTGIGNLLGGGGGGIP